MRRVRSQFLQSVSPLAWAGALLATAVAATTLVAAPAASAAGCPNAAIRASQGAAVEALPDCMALEMVSPPQKFSQDSDAESVSSDGERVVFLSKTAIGDGGLQQGLRSDSYVGSRTPAGWTVTRTLPRLQGDQVVLGWGGGALLARSFSPDFSEWVEILATAPQVDRGEQTVFRGGLDGSLTALAPPLIPFDGGNTSDLVISTTSLGVSADLTSVYFGPGRKANLDRPPLEQARYFSDAPLITGTSTDSSVYVAGPDVNGDPSVALLARDGAGTVWGGRCGVRLGGSPNQVGSGQGSQGSISTDGARVYFSTRPGQVGSGACDDSANRLRIMKRTTGPGGPAIGELIASECTRVAPACSAVDGDDRYQAASVDGTKVYFTTTRQLADSDLDVGTPGTQCTAASAAPGCDLYLYDSAKPAGQRLLQVSAGDAGSPTPGDGADVRDGVAAISGDGSHAYFVAEGVLTADANSRGQTATAGQLNLYNFTHDAGGLAFIGQAAASDDGLWGATQTSGTGTTYPVPMTGDGNGLDTTGGSGHVLLFESLAPFTSDDSDGGRRDLFRYDAHSGETIRVTKAAPGGSDNGPFSIDTHSQIDRYRSRVGADYAQFNRWVSEDGNTVVFTTSEALAPDDDNDTFDDYLWRGGQLYRLPGTSGRVSTGTNAQNNAALSHDGSVISFGSVAQLLPRDGDTAVDVYVARVGGGFPPEAPPVPCDVFGDECRGGSAAPLAVQLDARPGGDNASPTTRGAISVKKLSPEQRATLRAGHRASVSVRVNQAGTIRVAGDAPVRGKRRRVISASRAARKSGTLGVPVQLSVVGRRELTRTGKLSIRLRVSFNKAREPVVRTLTLKSPRRTARAAQSRLSTDRSR